MKLAVLFMFSVFLGVSHGATWNHDQSDATNGPSGWGGSCQTGKRQSPIDFKKAEMKPKAEAPFTFTNYDKPPTTVMVKNTGHGINVEFTSSSADTPKISGGGLPEEYTLAQFHFHWGQDNTKAIGSEHTVDGVAYINEVHFVHAKSKFATIGEALAEPEPNENLAVIGAFFELTDTDNPDLDAVINAMSAVSANNGGTNTVTPFAFDKWLPKKKNVFYRYLGSLTTPDCSEFVLWTVLEDKIPISKAQMAKFQELTLDGTKALGNNYRPVTALNGRDVFRVVGNSDCCPYKQVSGMVYELSDSDPAGTAKYSCSDACVYKKDGKKFCFKDDDAGMDTKCLDAKPSRR